MSRARRVDYVDRDADRRMMQGIPRSARKAFGDDLTRLQRGDDALQYEPLSGYGKGVGELKRSGWRVVVSLVDDPSTIWIVCVFAKDSKRRRRMRPEHDRLITNRLKTLRANLAPVNPRKH